MIESVFVLVLAFAYLTTGLFVARAEYVKRVRAYGRKPEQIIPKKPKRPEIAVNELLHTVSRLGSRYSCSLLDGDKACNCSTRDDWIKLKNDWADYREWNSKYGSLEESVSATIPFAAVPFWPVYFAKSFIEKGAVGIPDYRLIEQYDRELIERYDRELEKGIDNL